MTRVMIRQNPKIESAFLVDSTDGSRSFSTDVRSVPSRVVSLLAIIIITCQDLPVRILRKNAHSDCLRNCLLLRVGVNSFIYILAKRNVLGRGIEPRSRALTYC